MVLKRTGILGGTFDPPHQGHLEIARQAQTQAGLDRVIFIPAAQPRLKSAQPHANPQHRLAMLRLATDNAPNFEVSDIELRRPGPTQTVATLRQLRQQTGHDTELYFILGLDVLSRFHQWIEPQEITQLARLIAVSRPGYAKFDWPKFYAQNPHAAGRIECLTTPPIDLSASQLRRRLANGQPIANLIPPAVEQYIQKNGLYQQNPKTGKV